MVSDFCKSTLITILLTTILSVNGRPAESNVDNDLGDKNGVQMYTWNYKSTRTEVPSPSKNVYSSSLPPSNSVPAMLWPMLISATSSSNNRHVHISNTKKTTGGVKFQHVITTSRNETAANVECKSESRPLFLKSILNRLRSQKESIQTDSAKMTSAFPPKEIECQSQSKVLSLRINATNREKSSHNASRRISRREHARELLKSPSGHEQVVIPHAIPASQNFGDRIKQYYIDKFMTPSSLMAPYTLQKENLYSNHARQLGISNAERQSDFLLNNTLRNESFEYLQKHNTTVENIFIEMADPSRQSFARSDSPVTTKIILRPLAKAKAGQNGVAISSPISTAYIKRGDYVEIEYFPEATADVGEGGVAVSRPELIIHFIDRRKK